MDTNNYYTPDIEDFFYGYEMEFYNSFEYFLFETSEGWTKTIIGLSPGLRSVENVAYFLAKGLIRTPFLTKEQIEAEGWGGAGGQYSDFTFERFYRPYDGNSWYELEYDYSSHWLEIITMKADPYKGEPFIFITHYNGHCPSINEFRKICKWIGI